ncbi:hypothetical protein DFH05DRAFT_906756 [Lentinula detonsa]|uniref:Uncharacterized protein n=1 Tax=Lentinula detonsa TaxID=2804962 RepID=A0A9W8P3A3_9AGAR|nr:hypothetical protein DFH05DRAFT_906756 [Lentinula detonsa]
MMMIPGPSLLQSEPQTKLSSASQLFASNLRALGGLSIDEFLNTPEEDLPPIRYDFGFRNATSPWYYKPETQALPKLTAVQQLENACKEAFGRIDVLQFNVDPNAPSVTSVLHVVKNNEMRRTYTGERQHKTEFQAREEVAQVALREGALTYILDVDDTMDTDSGASNNPVKRIDDCFSRWRPGINAPQWFTYEHGAALKVQLASPRIFRVFSTPENTKSDAQVLCARLAIDSGVLEFIKFGDGQVRPSSPNSSVSDSKDTLVWLNVQEFIKTLPRPFPEPEFEDNPQKIEDEILQWFNKLSQDANKARTDPLKLYFHFLQVKHSFGCVLRIETPDSDPTEARTYLVEPRFSKKVKAKVGVCIQAMSENVGGFLRTYFPVESQTTTSTVLSLLTPQMRQLANQTLWPMLEAACQEIGPQATIMVHYSRKAGKFGCTLTAVVPSLSDRTTGATPNDSGKISRKWSVPTTYSCRPDARIALLCETGESVLQFIRFPGVVPSRDQPRPTKKSKQEKLLAVPMHSLAGAKPKIVVKKQAEKQRQAQAITVPKKAPKDWDEDTNQPGIDLTYELEPGEIVDAEAVPNTFLYPPSFTSYSNPSRSSGTSNLKRKRGTDGLG